MEDDLETSDLLVAQLTEAVKEYASASRRLAKADPTEEAVGTARAAKELLATLHHIEKTGTRTASAQNRALLDGLLEFYEKWSQAVLEDDEEEKEGEGNDSEGNDEKQRRNSDEMA